MMAAIPKKKHIIVVCGGLSWDTVFVTHRFPKPGETYNAKSSPEGGPGGKGANTAIAVHRLSHVKPAATEDGKTPRNKFEDHDIDEIEVRMIAAVGSDKKGRRMKNSLEQNFVNVDGVRMVDSKSGIASISVTSRFFEPTTQVCPNANHFLQPKDFLDAESFGAQRPDLVISQLELNRETVAQLITTAKKAGIDVLLNPSPAHYLDDDIFEGLPHLILNKCDAATLTGREIECLGSGFDDWIAITDEFLGWGIQRVVIMLGANQAFFSEQKGKGEYAVAEEVDEDNRAYIGNAEDTFVGAYAVEWVRKKQRGEWDLRSTVEYACKASTQTIEQVGCQDSIPWASGLKFHN